MGGLRTFGAVLVGVATVVGSIVAVAAYYDEQDSGSDNRGERGSTGVDSCVVGTWQSTAYEVNFNLAGSMVGLHQISGFSTLTLRDDSSGEETFANGPTIRGEAQDHVVEISSTGSFMFTYTTASGKLNMSNGSGDAAAQVRIDGIDIPDDALDHAADTGQDYLCSGNELQLSNVASRITYRRL